MNGNTPEWIWSEAYQQYYYIGYAENGDDIYVWQNELSDSGNPATTQMAQSMLAVPPGLIRGSSGHAETLDSSYYVRSIPDQRRFFILGRVFAMLYSEPAGNTASNNGNDEAYSAIRFGEQIYSTVRRFVVVQVQRGFVYACGISTYSGRATTKSGCEPSEHSIVYFQGTDPASCLMPGEWEGVLYVKEPIQVTPADSSLTMKRESRIRFSKTIPVEMNVKVKDIGRVHPEDMNKLLSYWTYEWRQTAA